MKFFSFALALGAASLLDTVFADASVAVDRLVSKRHLTKRDAGFANGGNSHNSGKGVNGKPRNSANYELSFYHVNDVHS